MENKKRIVSYLRDIKNGKLKMNIDFFDEGGQKIGVLKPVLSDHIRDNSDIAKFITRWRTYYKDNFFTQFEATEERTKNWLETQVINRDDKILFMIETNDKKIVGHAGVVFQEDYTLGELDNIVKDKDCKIPGIMTYSLKALINFLFNFLKIELLTLRVFSDNLKALALYSRCGFSKVKEIGLRKETTDDEIRYVEIRENNFQTADNTMFVMNLGKEDFNKNIKNLIHKMDPISEFKSLREKNLKEMSDNKELKNIALEFIEKSAKYKYSYNFDWLGRPIIQHPEDIVAMQEIIWKVKPDLIIETGIAHGGSLIFYASMLELIGGDGQVLGIDIDIREHNRIEIEKHPMYKRITMIQGSSVDDDVIEQVMKFAEGKKRVLVCLDSLHTHEHVLKELELYSPLVTKGSYLVVFDTIVEDLPEGFFSDRPWDKGNNPKTAVWGFLKTNDRFEIDKEIENKLLITVAPDGYLKCIKD